MRKKQAEKQAEEARREDLRAELYQKASRLVDALYAYDMVTPMDDVPIADLPKPMRDLVRRRRWAVWEAQDDLHITVATIRYHGWG